MRRSGVADPDVREETSREAIVNAARRLFGERGYNAVTIREVAAEAGFSPAMVMKVVGSKAQLFTEAAPMEPERAESIPHDELGRELVRRLLDRRDNDTAEPWARALWLTHDSPDPNAARAEFRDRYLKRLTELLGDAPDAERRASLVACMLLGLAGGVRTLRLLDPAQADPEGVIEQYGGLIQSVIDGPP